MSTDLTALRLKALEINSHLANPEVSALLPGLDALDSAMNTVLGYAKIATLALRENVWAVATKAAESEAALDMASRILSISLNEDQEAIRLALLLAAEAQADEGEAPTDGDEEGEPDPEIDPEEGELIQL